MNTINRFNYRLMTALANANATAWTFYLLVFAILKVWTISPPHSLLEWLNSIVQTLYQGSALPLLAFVSKLEGDRQSRKIDETHDASMAIQADAAKERALILQALEEIKAIRADETKDNEMMKAIMTKLNIDNACDELMG